MAKTSSTTTAQTPTTLNHKPRRSTLKTIAIIVGYLLWVSICFIGSQFLLAFLFSLFLTKPATAAVTTIYSALAYALSLVLIIFFPPLIKKLVSKSSKEPSSKKLSLRTILGLTDTPTWTDILLAIVGFLVYAALAAVLLWLFAQIFPWFDSNEAQSTGFGISLYTISDRLLAFIALVLIAPIAEELIFRGWLYKKLRDTIPGRASLPISILLVSLLFAILHFQWNVSINVFALSIILCLLRELTGTTYAGILLHIIKNALAFYLLYCSF